MHLEKQVKVACFHVSMVAEVDYYSNVKRFNARRVNVFVH